MKTSIRLAALAVAPLFAVGHLAAAQNVNGNHEGGGVEAEIRSLNAQEVSALLAHDTKTLAAIWSDDFVVTNPVNKLVTKQQVLAMMESGALVITALSRQIEYVHVYGDFVVVAGSETATFAGTLPLAGKTAALRFTNIWTRQAGRWRQVARHANIVPQPQ